MCSIEYTFGVLHVDDVGDDLGDRGWLSSVVTIFENKGFLEMLKRE